MSGTGGTTEGIGSNPEIAARGHGAEEVHAGPRGRTGVKSFYPTRQSRELPQDPLQSGYQPRR